MLCLFCIRPGQHYPERRGDSVVMPDGVSEGVGSRGTMTSVPVLVSVAVRDGSTVGGDLTARTAFMTP